ncbi:V-type ATP synthase beta chain 1, partial [Frankliniella fusca]
MTKNTWTTIRDREDQKVNGLGREEEYQFSFEFNGLGREEESQFSFEFNGLGREEESQFSFELYDTLNSLPPRLHLLGPKKVTGKRKFFCAARSSSRP